MTAEERARQKANERRFADVLQRRLERDGTTIDEVWRRLGLPGPHRRTA
jgi:hypothetical protein